MSLRDKVVFITGGAGHIGRGVAEAILQKGAKVWIADISESLGEATAKELNARYGDNRAQFVKCDVSDAVSFENAFKTAVSKHGHIDVLCNNAAKMDETNWELAINCNLGGVVRGTMLAMDHMRKDKGGKGGVIINTASMAGLYSNSWFPLYNATKSAVIHFTDSWTGNPEMEPAGIRLVSICPSAVKGTFDPNNMTNGYNMANFRETLKKASFCTVEQVAEAFLLAIEDDSTNGAVLAVIAEGGITRMMRTVAPASVPTSGGSSS